MEKNRSGLFVYYRWLLLLLASGLCLLPLWATVMGGFKTSGRAAHQRLRACLASGCSTTTFRSP